MRTLTDHKLTGLNESISITALDQPGPGGANHEYGICIPPENEGEKARGIVVTFQNGPIGEAGVNGISNEALLAILIDRLRGFQYTRTVDDVFTKSPGPYACRENAVALTKLEEAMMWLQKRT